MVVKDLKLVMLVRTFRVLKVDFPLEKCRNQLNNSHGGTGADLSGG
jgi:hypothetical protein